jgi:tetratricopeptide (TPR) repeat protein
MPDTLTPIDLSKEGQAAYATRRFSEAARAYEQAARAYQAGGDAFNAAEAFNNASVAALQANDAPNAYRLAEGTDQVFSLSSDLRRQGMALANQAAALEALQRLPEALERYQRSSDLLKHCRACPPSSFAPGTSFRRWLQWTLPSIIKRSFHSKKDC